MRDVPRQIDEFLQLGIGAKAKQHVAGRWWALPLFHSRTAGPCFQAENPGNPGHNQLTVRQRAQAIRG